MYLEESTDVVVWLNGKKAAPVRTVKVAERSMTTTIAGSTYAKGYARTYKPAELTPNYYVTVLRNPNGVPIDVTVRYVQ